MGEEKPLEFLLFSGNYEAVVARTSGGTDPAAMPTLIGALALSGRLDEAQSAFRTLPDDAEELAQARFFLVAGLCHAGHVRRAMRLVRASLADLGRPRGKRRFWIWQGLALVRYFEGRFARARAAARKALGTAIEAAFPYARVLTLDLLAHVFIQTGQVHAGMRLLGQASDLAASLGYRDNTVTLDTAAAVYRLQYLLDDLDRACADVREAVAKPAVSFFTRRNGLVELATARALAGDAAGAKRALDEARAISLPGSDRRGRTRWLIAQALIAALGDGAAAAEPLIGQAYEAAGEQLMLRAEVGFVDAVFAGVSATTAEALAELARQTGIVRARIAANHLHDAPQPHPTQIEDGLARLLLSCWSQVGEARLSALTNSGLWGLLPWALGWTPGRRLVLTDSQLISEDHGRVTAASAPSGPSLRLLTALAEGFREREDLARDVWGLARYHPSKHNAVINTAVSRLRGAMAEPSWIVTHEQGYHLLAGVELCLLTGNDVQTEVGIAPPDPEAEAVATLLRREGPMSSGDIARALKQSSSSALRLLRRLVDEGRIERSGSGRATRYELPRG